MRLGLLISGSRPANEAAAVARAAEQAGAAEIWVSEDYFERGAFTVAAAVAAATTAASVGIGVVNPFTRHPLVTAMEFASLDELSGGRAVLGLGASNPVWIERRCGIPFTAPLAALEEAVEIIRAVLAGEHVRTSGRHYRVDASLSFRPARKDPPIYLGSKGRRSLRLAGRIGDGVLLSLLSAPAYVTWAREQVTRPVPSSAYVLAACAADPRAARQAVRRPLATYLGVHGPHDITQVAGMSPVTATAFREAWLAGTPAEHLVTDELIDTFAVAGDRDQCRYGLQRLADAGLTTAVLRDPADRTLDDLLELIADFQPSPTIGAHHDRHP